MEKASKEVLACDIKVLKDRLMDYREREREIDNQIERIENMEAKMISLHSPELSDMPKAKNSVQDRIGNMFAVKEEAEKSVRELIRLQAKEREWIQGLLRNVKKADERACIQMRYLDCESWSKVSMMLFGHKDDYYDRRDSYLRRTTKIHCRAIERMAEAIKE